MRPKRSPVPSKPLQLPGEIFPWREALRQAWGLFLFASIFAVIFNAFYVDGIELKFKPAKPYHLMDHPIVPTPIPGLTGARTPAVPKRPTPIPSASDGVIRVGLSGAKNRFDKKNCVFLDARKPEEYREGHIAGALNFYGNELDRFAPQVIPQLTDKGQEIIVYCHGGDCDLSLLVAKSLIESGYTRVEIFAGGWPEWKKAGYPVDPGDNP